MSCCCQSCNYSVVVPERWERYKAYQRGEAIGAGKALSDAGYKVPEDISLAGFDGVEIGKYVIPSLTTLKQPVDSMARETARILFDIIGKKAKHQHCVFDGELVVRDSTMPRT